MISETRRAGYKVGKNSEIFSHFMYNCSNLIYEKKILSNGRRKKIDVLGTSVQYSEYNTKNHMGGQTYFQRRNI